MEANNKEKWRISWIVMLFWCLTSLYRLYNVHQLSRNIYTIAFYSIASIEFAILTIYEYIREHKPNPPKRSKLMQLIMAIILLIVPVLQMVMGELEFPQITNLYDVIIVFLFIVIIMIIVVVSVINLRKTSIAKKINFIYIAVIFALFIVIYILAVLSTKERVV